MFASHFCMEILKMLDDAVASGPVTAESGHNGHSARRERSLSTEEDVGISSVSFLSR